MASMPIPTDEPNIEKLIRLVRLSDMKHASHMADEGIEIMWKWAIEVDRLNHVFMAATKKYIQTKDPSAFDGIEPGLPFIKGLEGTMKWWDYSFAQDVNYCERFIQILKEMRLDVSEEMETLRQIQIHNEKAIQAVIKWIAEPKDRKIERPESLQASVDGIVAVRRELIALDKTLDKRIKDAVSLLSRTLTSVAAEQLYQLFTRDPLT
jgi:hypothetical protein